MKSIAIIVFAVLAFMLVDQAYAYEGSVGSVYVQITQDAKTTTDYDAFIIEINNYVKTQKVEDFTDRKLLTMIVKFKNTYIGNHNKIVAQEKQVENIKEILADTKAKKEYQKIKHKIVLEYMLNHKYHELDLDVEVLEYTLALDKPRLIDFSMKDIIKQYKNFKDFDEKGFVKEVKDKNFDVKSFVKKTKDKIDKIIKSRDSYNMPQNSSSPKCSDDNGNRINCSDKNKDKSKPDNDNTPNNDPPKDPKPPKKDKPPKDDKPKKDKKKKK